MEDKKQLYYWGLVLVSEAGNVVECGRCFAGSGIVLERKCFEL